MLDVWSKHTRASVPRQTRFNGSDAGLLLRKCLWDASTLYIIYYVRPWPVSINGDKIREMAN